jgi:hypothetical protein
MSKGRSLLLLSCSHTKRPGGVSGAPDRRSFPEMLSPEVRRRVLGRRNEVCRMLGGGPPRLYDGVMGGGYRDERLTNRKLKHGRDFGATEAADYLPAFERYAGRLSDQLASLAPNFWEELPPSIEIIFVSGLYGLAFWDEAIQDYDCHFADYTDDPLRRKLCALWGSTLSDALIEFLQRQSRSAPIRAVYDLLSERLYEDLFAWNKIQGATVYHRIFKRVAGADTLAPIGQILATDIRGFACGKYKPGWFKLPKYKDEEPLEFGFEAKLGDDPEATREGDIERTRNDLLNEQRWLSRILPQLQERIVLAELSWRKTKDFPQYEWGGLAVSFVKPLESFLKVHLGLVGAETLGEVISRLRSDRDWSRAVFADLEELNSLFRRGKHEISPSIVLAPPGPGPHFTLLGI